MNRFTAAFMRLKCTFHDVFILLTQNIISTLTVVTIPQFCERTAKVRAERQKRKNFKENFCMQARLGAFQIFANVILNVREEPVK